METFLDDHKAIMTPGFKPFNEFFVITDQIRVILRNRDESRP